jgi:hypothetical protein
VLIGALSIVSAIFSSFIIAIVLALIYVGIFVFIIVKAKKMSDILAMKVHFNLALTLKNENDKLFNKYGIKARPGYLSKWIELHQITNLKNL